MGNCACAQGQGEAKSGAAEATPMPHGSKPQAAAAGPDAPHGFAVRVPGLPGRQAESLKGVRPRAGRTELYARARAWVSCYVPPCPLRKAVCTPRRGMQARYRAIKLLGRGAEADTWLFADRKRNLPIAIKLFARPVSKKLVASILREIRLQSLLGPGHMNLINIYEVMLTRDHLGIAMARSCSLTCGAPDCCAAAAECRAARTT